MHPVVVYLLPPCIILILAFRERHVDRNIESVRQITLRNAQTMELHGDLSLAVATPSFVTGSATTTADGTNRQPQHGQVFEVK